MRILVVTPARPGSRTGNRVTALRWARLLRDLGHGVRVAAEYRGQPADLLVALHARKSFPSIARYRREHPRAPVVVALTGTDLYGDLPSSPVVHRALELATRIVVLQPRGVEAVPAGARGKTRVILQSAASRPRRLRRRPRRNAWEVCVLGHLRAVKDPFRTAAAARLLPPSSRVRVLHVGAAIEPGMASRARAEERRNARYRWLGGRPHGEALDVLARSRLLCLTSTLEGGANVVSEAAAAGVPVLSSRIDGSLGLLGPRYPGYFPVGDSRRLAALLERAESDPRFYTALRRGVRRLGPRVRPGRERAGWASLLAELARGGSGTSRPSRARTRSASAAASRGAWPRASLSK